MQRRPKWRKKIRRFTEDVLSKEMKASIQEMAKAVSQDVSRKALAANKREY